MKSEMTGTSLSILTLLTLWLSSCTSLRVLVLHPFYSGSHVLSLSAVSRVLVQRGHHVTTVRFADPHGLELEPLVNHSEVLLHMNNSDGRIPYFSHEEKASFQLPLELMWRRGHDLSSLFDLENPWKVVQHYCHRILGDQALYERLEKARFDVVVLDLIYNECGLALVRHLDLPVVGYWAFSLSSGESEFTLAATPPSHIPVFMSELTDTMSFFQRVFNLFAKMFARGVMLYHTFVCDEVISQYLPRMRSSQQLLSELNGLLINSHSALDYPRLMPESFVNVGGMQIEKHNLNNLPHDLKMWLESSEEDVVLFSLGFIFSTKTVPRERLRTILDAFEALAPLRVVLKLDALPPELIRPKNVYIASFLPQQALLNYNRTKVFVTHCGLHGVMEALYAGVPMVGMPLFGDQTDVLVRMVNKGVGIGIHKFATKKQIVDAVLQVYHDHKYRENVRRLSRLMQLEPVSPMSRAVNLIEYVANTKGAEHLLLSSRHLNFFQYSSLDVICLLIIVLFLSFKIFVFIKAQIRRFGLRKEGAKKKVQ